ncbi:hypothetical protein, partial [Salmonella enterica]|uniref:hypothetical protein n=1 Tax=Salmonella enterica TaxID=28901 RepID=UPI0019D5510E
SCAIHSSPFFSSRSKYRHPEDVLWGFTGFVPAPSKKAFSRASPHKPSEYEVVGIRLRPALRAGPLSLVNDTNPTVLPIMAIRSPFLL